MSNYNCFIVAFKNGKLLTFLSNKEKSLAGVKEMCLNKGVMDDPSDFLCVEGGAPEPAALESYYVDKGKIKFNQDKFFQFKFREEDQQIINLLLKNNEVSLNFYKSENHQRFLALCKDNTDYLNKLTYKDVYSGSIKNNVYFNIVGFNVKNPGRGYSKPVTMTVSSPENSSNDKIKKVLGVGGRKVEFSLVQRDNILKNIDVSKWGSGYVDPPHIDFSEPDDPNGEKPVVDIVMLNIINL